MKNLGTLLIPVLKKFTAVFSALLAIWQLIVCTSTRSNRSKSSEYPNSLQHFSDFPNLLMGTLNLCLHSGLNSFLINHHTVPRILIVQASCRLTSSCCNLLRKPCCLPRLSHNLHNSLQVVLRHCSSFLLFCAIRNASCYRFFFAAFIWLDSGYIQIIRP